MAKFKIIINGTGYPCYLTMGAALEFKQMTGHDVSEMKVNELVEIGTMLFCQCKAACRREKMDFPYSYEDFMDQLTDEDILALSRQKVTDNSSKKK